MNIDKKSEIEKIKKYLMDNLLKAYENNDNLTATNVFLSKLIMFLLWNIQNELINTNDTGILKNLIDIYNIACISYKDEVPLSIKIKIDYMLGLPNDNYEKLSEYDKQNAFNIKESLKIGNDFLTSDQFFLLEKIINNPNIEMMIAPTSFGKSFLVRKIVEMAQESFLIIAPTLALINEYETEFSNLDRNNIVVITTIDSYKQIDKTNKRIILILTPEKATALTDNQLNKVEHVIIDEIYEWMIRLNDERSYTFFNFRKRIKDKKVLYISPADFLNENLENKVVKSDLSLTTQIFFTFAIEDKKKIIILKNPTTLLQVESPLNLFFLKISNDKNLIYGTKSGKASVIEGAEKLNKFMINNNLGFKESELINHFDYIVIKSYIESTLIPKENLKDYLLMEYIDRGILIHHGDVEKTLRKMIEIAFKNSKVFNFMFANTTLTKGVNLKADNLFMTSYLTGGGNEKIRLEQKNIIGRVGRINFDKGNFDYKRAGKVFLLEPLKETDKTFILGERNEQEKKIKKNTEDKKKKEIFNINKKINESKHKEKLKNKEARELSLLYKTILNKSTDDYKDVDIKALQKLVDPEELIKKQISDYKNFDFSIPNVNVLSINEKIKEKNERIKEIIKNIGDQEFDYELIDLLQEIYEFTNYYDVPANTKDDINNIVQVFKINFDMYAKKESFQKIIQRNLKSNYYKKKLAEHDPNKVSLRIFKNNILDEIAKKFNETIYFLKVYLFNLFSKLDYEPNELEEKLSRLDDNYLDSIEILISQITKIDNSSVVKEIKAKLSDDDFSLIKSNNETFFEIMEKWENTPENQKFKNWINMLNNRKNI